MQWIQGNQRRRCQFCGQYKTVGVLSPKHASFICKVCADKVYALIPVDAQPKQKIVPTSLCDHCGKPEATKSCRTGAYLCDDCALIEDAEFSQSDPVCELCKNQPATKHEPSGQYLCAACTLDADFMDQG